MGPVKVAVVGFVGKVKRSAGNRQPVGSVELYGDGNETESGQGRDCDSDG